ncbi:MAG: hypothetical protein K6C98_03760 [Treponema sp.]|nr:hypothetical protein [Treponema sp.]
MTVFIILIALIIPIILHFVLVRKIQNKTYKVCMSTLNFLLSLIFIILLIAIGFVKNHLSSYIDMGISQLEQSVNEIYPNALEKQMSTEELKNLLEESLKKNESDGIEAIAENVIKSKIKKYTSTTLKTINALERENNKLSVKDALVSIKELSLNTINPYYKLAKVLLFVLYFLLIIVSILITIHLIKDKDSFNEGIVFGEEADKTFIGMKTE